MGRAKLKPDCPTPDELSRALGFRIPTTLHALIQAAFTAAGGSYDRFSSNFEDALGIIPAHRWLYTIADGRIEWDDVRYQQTPPELVPFWTTGVDGEHGGLLVHAPELVWEEYPVASICPMDGDGVVVAALNVTDALAAGLSAWNRPEVHDEVEPDPERLRLARILADAVGITDFESQRPLRRRRRLGPLIPGGWRYEPSSDGVGVLAPAHAFSRDPVPLPVLDTPIDSVLGQARRLLYTGSPASALLVLRESYWHEWSYNGVIAQLTPLMIETYHRLGRPLHAAGAAERFVKIQADEAAFRRLTGGAS